MGLFSTNFRGKLTKILGYDPLKPRKWHEFGDWHQKSVPTQIPGKCPKCKTDLYDNMLYSCPKANCPIFIKSTL